MGHESAPESQGDKRRKCPICKKSFYSSTHVEIHENTVCRRFANSAGASLLANKYFHISYWTGAQGHQEPQMPFVSCTLRPKRHIDKTPSYCPWETSRSWMQRTILWKALQLSVVPESACGKLLELLSARNYRRKRSRKKLTNINVIQLRTWRWAQQNVHEKLRPYVCRAPGCRRNFGNLWNRRKHERNVHGIPDLSDNSTQPH